MHRWLQYFNVTWQINDSLFLLHPAWNTWGDFFEHWAENDEKSLRLNEDFLQAQNKGRHRRKPAWQAGFKAQTKTIRQENCHQSSTFNHPFYPRWRVMANGKKCGIMEKIPQFQRRRRSAMTNVILRGLDNGRGLKCTQCQGHFSGQ